MTDESRLLNQESFGLDKQGHYEHRLLTGEEEIEYSGLQSSLAESGQDLAPEKEEEKESVFANSFQRSDQSEDAPASMIQSIEEETETPPQLNRPFRPFINENVLTSSKGRAVFHPEVISDMHEQVLRNNREELK